MTTDTVYRPGTTATSKEESVAAEPGKLRIKDEYLPQSAKYATFDNVEYVMIPVAEFGDWYEDMTTVAILKDREEFDDPEAYIPIEEVGEEIRSTEKKSRHE